MIQNTHIIGRMQILYGAISRIIFEKLLFSRFSLIFEKLYSAKAIHRFMDLLADSGVDSFPINPNSQVACFPGRSIPTVPDRYVRDDPGIGSGEIW